MSNTFRDIKKVLKEIEEKRAHLEMIVNFGANPTDPNVLEASRQLDRILNEYERILRHNSKERSV